MWNSFRKRHAPARLLVFVLIPGVALLLTVGVGYLKWRTVEARAALTASTESVQAASETTVALLSYRPDTVEENLVAVRDRLTGGFRDAFTSLTADTVIPGARQKQIISSATVPAAASIEATDEHAVVLVFVDQTTIVGTDPPTQTTSTVKVTLDKIGKQWLVSDFTPL